MNIDRNNYEEFFILYLDNELNNADRSAVEAFAMANPDLQEELDMLMQTKLSPDADITFDHKEELLKFEQGSAIQKGNYEEWLLSYIDNELTPAQRITVEAFVAANPAIARDLSLLQQTKLQPEAIVFPNKESLYRTEQKTRVVSIRWWRIAVAAVLLIGLSTGMYQMMESRKALDGGIAKRDTVGRKDRTTTPETSHTLAVHDPATETKQDNTTNISSQVEPNSTEDNTVRHTDATSTTRDNTNGVTRNNVESNTIATNTNNNDRNLVVANPTTTGASSLVDTKTGVINQPAVASNISINKSTLTNSEGNKPSTNVTDANGYTSDMQEQRLTEQDIETAESNQSGKKSKLRGFFRKVTRTFEKTTNMKATDEEDRLLVGGLAIKL